LRKLDGKVKGKQDKRADFCYPSSSAGCVFVSAFADAFAAGQLG
jgi:hypothetical protein